MIGIMLLILAAFIVLIKMVVSGEFPERYIDPWEKAERKAEKRRQREQAKIRKREMRCVYGK